MPSISFVLKNKKTSLQGECTCTNVKSINSCEQKKKGNKIVSIDGFPPIMPRTILNCMEESKIDFARYSDDNYEFNELNNIKNALNIGDEITLTINRNGEEKDITLTLAETP